MSDTFTIGVLADEFRVTLRTLRFYEERGLLRPERRGTTRIYSAACRERVRRIVEWTGYGFTLAEVGQMLGKTDREIMPALAERLGQIEEEAGRLRAAEESLRQTLRALEDRWAA